MLNIELDVVILILSALTRRASDDKDESKWDDIVGLDHVKRIFRENYINPRRCPRAYGPPDSGILLFGPPGTGKTKSAKAMAMQSKANFFHISAAEHLGSGNGGYSLLKITALFKIARTLPGPSIIFLMSARRSSARKL